MPWTTADVDSFNKGLSAKKKRKWVSVANRTLRALLSQGKPEKEAAAQAVKTANAAVTEQWLRIRQVPMSAVEKGSIRTVTLSEAEGIRAAIGRTEEGKRVTQSVLFESERWTAGSAKRWITENKVLIEGAGDMNGVAITETVFTPGTLKVDRERGIIEGVKLLGASSANGNDYSEQVITEDAPRLYEGVKVFINHPYHPTTGKPDPGRPRDLRDVFGKVEQVQGKTGDGVFGNLHFNPTHEMAESVAWFAENMPGVLGFSHNARGAGKKVAGRFKVESLVDARSVDLVADPATTKGLFESVSSWVSDSGETGTREGIDKVDSSSNLAALVEGELADAVKAEQESEKLRVINRQAERLIWSVLDDDELTFEAKKTRIVSVLDEWETLLSSETAETTEGKSTEMDMKDLTLAELKKSRPDILEQVDRERADTDKSKETLEENARLKKENDEFRAANALREKRERIDAKLAESKLPKEAVTDTFRDTLLEAKDDDAVDALIKDRKEFVVEGKSRPKQKGKDALDNKSGGTKREVNDSKSFTEAVFDR